MVDFKLSHWDKKASYRGKSQANVAMYIMCDGDGCRVQSAEGL